MLTGPSYLVKGLLKGCEKEKVTQQKSSLET